MLGDMTNTVTIPRIEVCRAGTWRSMKGETTITAEDLRAAVEASQDPEIDRGRVKLGHVSALNDMLGDGAPAFGWLSSPEVSEDGKSLFVDLVDVPRKLAKHIGHAYKQRSVELRRNVTTPSGKTYRAALTGLALLGASAPAVKGLDDLEAIYASHGDESTEDETIVVTLSDDLEMGDDTADVHQADSDQLDTGQDDSGSGPDADTDTDEEEEPTVAFLEQAREKLGLPESATEDEILAAMGKTEAPADTADEGEEQTGTEGETPDADETDAEGETEDEDDEKLSAGPKTVKVSESVWRDVTGRLDALEKSAAKAHRKRVIEEALSAGKISPAERKHWEKTLAKSPESTETLLSELPSRINVVESGTDQLSEGEDEDDFNPADYWAAQGLADFK